MVIIDDDDRRNDDNGDDHHQRTNERCQKSIIDILNRLFHQQTYERTKK